MNTLDKVKNLQLTVREQGRTNKNLIGVIDRLNRRNIELSKRIEDIEEILIDKLQDIFEGENSPLSDLEDRLLKLEGAWRD